MDEPSCVHVLSSGVEPINGAIGPHPLEMEDIDNQVREMERVRAQALVSSRDYLII